MAEYQPPSQQWLEDEAERVYKLLNPKEYAREKVKPGAMAEYRQLSAESCRSLAGAMSSQGMRPEEAWRRAIRESLQRTVAD